VGQGNDETVDSPAQIREAIAQARTDLGAHLSALGDPQLPNGADGPGDQPMPAKRASTARAKSTDNSKSPIAKTAKPTVKSAKPKGEKAVKADSAAKPKSKPKSKPKAKAKTSTPAKIVKGAAATAGHALDAMAAGAVVGAVKAAAKSIAEKESKGRRKSSPSTGKVLGEMAPDAAMGALAGAAEAMLPDGIEANPVEAKTTDSKPKKSRAKSPARKSR